MPNLMSRQHLERPVANGWLYLVADNKDYRIKVEDLLKLVTKELIGLGKVDNTNDEEKPISTAVREALKKKVNPSDLENLVGRAEFSSTVQDLTARIQALIDRQPQDPVPGPGTPTPPAKPSINVDDIVSEITSFWNKQKAEGGDFSRIDKGLLSVSEKASNLETQLTNLEETVQNIPRVTNAATQEDLASLSDRVNRLSQNTQESPDVTELKGKVEGLEPKVETLENKLVGLNSWSEFKTDYDRVADKAQSALNKAESLSGAAGGSNHTPDVYLKWLTSLQYRQEDKASYGAIAVHDSPATRANEKAYYKIEPYFASTAVYFGLEADPGYMAETARLWLNWWMKNVNPTTGSTLIHYTDGESVVTSLEGADPVVQPNHEDATDSNIAMFLLALERYVSLFGTDGLYNEWKKIVASAYDTLSNSNLKHSDQLTWAKSDYQVKFLMDNVEVWAGLNALSNLLEVAGDETRKSEVEGWHPRLQSAIYDTFWDDSQQNWKPSLTGEGPAASADMSKVYPDLLCQIWPELFGYDYHGAKADRFYESTVNWADGPLNTETNAVDAQVAYAYVSKGQVRQARRWLAHVPLKRHQGDSFTWPFTCADAGITAAVARMTFATGLSRLDRIEQTLTEINNRFLT